MPYSAMRTSAKTANSCGRLRTVMCTPNAQVPRTTMIRALNVVVNMPPTAMPSRMAISEVGAMM